ncbi:uncharacterized protein Dsimw501_GD23503, isoform J [Drosophila simulans]|uniref:Uncharacterized protein, isoform J n=2 Tax=Drosophila simulans TaxID=7240 RepID=A0A0J9TIH2_DROSI|nr:uncharacterized protein Dsimw501_GD23503, isoform J [Drosophila simulans]
MEAKFLASALSFLSIFLAIYAQSLANDLSKESTEFEESPTIYYGDPVVNLGQPFSITCIIPITDQIHWLKNGEPITRHNLRHGRDDHAYVLSESAIEGEKHKIEAHLSVRHALKVHEGRYQCNRRRGSYILHVRDPKGVGAGAGEPTESGYQTIDELTPNSADDFFTRAWLEQQQQQQQQQLPHQSHKLHKSHLGYGNASLSGSQPWHPSAGGGGGIHRVYSATPPDFPPPRLNLLEQTVAPPEPPTILYNPNPTHPTASATATETSVLLTTAHHHVHHQQQLQQQSQHTLNAFQLPLPPRPNPGQNERYQTYAPHYVPPVVVSGAGAGAEPGAGASGEQTTISAATSTRAMMGGGGGVAGSGFSAGASGPMLGAGGHMLMGGQGHQVHLQHQTLLPVKMDKLVPNYDNAKHQMKFYDIRSPLVLSCNVKDGTPGGVLIWKKNGTAVTEVPSLRGRFKLIADENKFIIDKTDTNDDGKYSCEFDGESKEIEVIARVVVRVPSNTAVVEGEKMSVTCSVVGTNPELTWTFANVTLTNATDRFILKPDDNGVPNAILTLENVTLEDRGEYKCIGRNAANVYGGNTTAPASDVTTVRVKGKFAALWPFLGICAEVLILCIIILIYEKRRNKSELEESDTDPQEHI